MPVVNFTLTKQLDKRINETVKQHGFSSKAEFFRMAAMNYLDEMEEPYPDPETSNMIKEVKNLIVKKYSGKKIPPLRDQLKKRM